MKIFYYFIQSIPESIGIIALSLALAKIELRWGRILAGGVLLSLLTYLIRSLMGFGFHLPVAIFVIFITITRMTNTKPSRVIVAIFSSFFTLALLEYLISNVFLAYTHMDFKQAFANEELWALVGIFQDSILIIIALVVSHFLKPIAGAWKIPAGHPTEL